MRFRAPHQVIMRQAGFGGRGRRSYKQKYATVKPQQERIGWMYWDRQTYVDNSTTRLVFFQQVRTLKRDGNIPLAGQLSNGMDFYIRSIRVIPIIRPRLDAGAGAAGAQVGIADDLALLYNDGVLSIDILNKPYGEWPMFVLLPGTGLIANMASFQTAAATGLETIVSYGNPDNRSVYTLATPLMVPRQTNFVISLDWATAVNTQSGNVDLDVAIDGHLERPQQ